MQSKKIEVFNDLVDKGSEKANVLHRVLMQKGIDFASGVPCGVLRHIISNLEKESRVLHVPANRESEAIGISAGAYFAGKHPILYMQNSGLFSASNDIASLLVLYKIPIFFIVTYRGCKGEDAVQHLVTGGATEKLLKSFSLYYQVFENQDVSLLVNEIFDKMNQTSLPTFLLLKRGWNL